MRKTEDSKLQRIAELRALGLTIKAIADQVQVSPGMVWKALHPDRTSTRLDHEFLRLREVIVAAITGHWAVDPADGHQDGTGLLTTEQLVAIERFCRRALAFRKADETGVGAGNQVNYLGGSADA